MHLSNLQKAYRNTYIGDELNFTYYTTVSKLVITC